MTTNQTFSAPPEVLGALRLLGIPDTQCFTDFKQIWKAIEQNFAVVLPVTITNVTVGPTQPLDTERNNVWFRTTNGGTFIGIYMFSDGTWRQFFPVPNSIYLISGDSRTPPDGYITTEDSASLDAAQRTFLKDNFWHQNASLLYYDIFTVVQAPF